MPLGLIVPAGVVATISCTATYAVAQSPTLPPLPAPARNAEASRGVPSEPAVNSRALLIRARAALSEGKSDAAALAFAQASLAAQNNPEMASEIEQTRKQLLEHGLNQQVLDKAMATAQAGSVLNSRAANALRNRTGANPAGQNGGLLAAAPASVGNAATGLPSSVPPAMLPPSTLLPSTLPPSMLPPLPSANNNAFTAQANRPPNPLRDQAVGLTAEAKMALDRGDVSTARNLIEKANLLRVPDSEFALGQVRPWNVALDIDRAERLRGNSQVMAASAQLPANGVQNATALLPLGTNPEGAVQSGLYQPKSDTSRVTPASGVLSSYDADESGAELYDKGLKALSSGDKEGALSLFKSAWQKRDGLDASARAQLKDKLTLLQSTARVGNEPESIETATPEGRENQLKRQRWFAEVTGEIADAERMAGTNKPMEALDKLKSLRLRVSQADVDNVQRKNLLTMVDRVTAHMQAWVDENKSTIELDQRNKQIEDKIVEDAIKEAKTDATVQNLVDQYNELIDERRFPEAEALAKKVSEIKPGSEIAAVLYNKAKIQSRVEENEDIRSLKQEKFADAMTDVERSSTPFAGDNPLQMPPVKAWSDLTRLRSAKTDLRMSPAERKIRESLAEQFSASFDRRPLSDAMNTISEMTGIPIIIDDRSIAEEGITVDQPITLDLKGNSISLKSAMNVMLERLNLTYSIKNEVLTIESSRFNKKELRKEVYNVKDLVIPIPNFVSDYNTGMAGALQSAYQAQTNFASATIRDENAASAASRIANIDPNSSVLAQVNTLASMQGMSPGSMAGGMPGNFPSSTVGLGGAAMANYFDLINLIEQTISPDSWQNAGGNSSMLEFRQNLSLVVTAPQETHESIADLLKSLRALQNLQVTIECRFMQLEDTFFERIGVDFDFNINDKINRLPRENGGPSVAVGLTSALGTGAPAFTNDLDINVRNNFTVQPPAGRPDAAAATTVGLAILSDLELFFFLEASQGNSRSNVLQAPKVTMFDGQTASINDTAQRPFVVSYDPVVGDFAVAQRPIIVVLSEGTQMNVQSVVSQDKRFVRMTLVPQFTRIESGEREFTFQGSRRSATGTTILNNGVPGNRPNQEDVIEGTTVQQPTFGQTSVTTTVSVPDGGTILLGGIKRLREARTERGTPILSKIPYLNRLFKNNAIGRETNTLMMTVTPRIIIPEEEEELLGVVPSRP